MMKKSFAHHGILGQKWGVRNGPPYPLNPSDHSAAEKKAASEKSTKGETSDSRISKGKDFVSKHGSVKVGQLPSREELLEVAAPYIAMFGIIGVLKGAAKISEVKERKKFNNELEEMKDDCEFKSLNDVPKLDKPVPPSESMKVVNPDYPKPGSNLNCTFCTTAMAMREKGYDVQAAKTPHAWYTDDLFKKTFNAEDTKMRNVRSAKDLRTQLESMGDGAYGGLRVQWTMGGGHSIFWKNEGGKVHIYDGQSGEEYDLKGNSSFMRSINFNNLAYQRLDNTEPTEYALALVNSRK